MTGCRPSRAWDLNKVVERGLFCVHVVLENSRPLTVFGPRFGICFAAGGGDDALF